VDLRIDKGQIFGLAGESGSGKTTLGRCALRSVDVTEGTVRFAGEDITHLRSKALRAFRRQAQTVFQDPYGCFNPKKTLVNALSEYARLLGIERQNISAHLARHLEEVALPPSVIQGLPSELSGGQLQRLAIARALLSEPIFLFADEPVSALDVSVQAQILQLMVDLNEKRQLSILIVSHDLAVLETICDTVAVIYRGRIVEQARTAVLFGDMRHPYTRYLMSSRPREHPDQVPMRMPGGEVTADVGPDGCLFAPQCPLRSLECERSSPQLKECYEGHLCACYHC
jgi:oligopeptide/dipeptide ABC transporter ATP-binding protein